jgi:membrane dipeptidase
MGTLTDVLVFDGHNDALTREGHAGLAAGRDGGHVDLPKMRAGGMRGGIFAVFSPSLGGDHWIPVPRDDGVVEFEYAQPLDRSDAAAHATAAAGRLFALERAGELRIARTIADFDETYDHAAEPADEETLPLAVLHLEGAEAIDPNLEALDAWYAAGLRSLGLVWSRANDFGHGVPFVFPSSPDIGPGLTGAGKRLVQRCADLGILIDLSHLNEAGFWDVARLGAGPLVASHAAAHALCPASRNLTNRQLTAIGESGGLVGIIFGCAFLRKDMEDDDDTPIALIAAHARYVADRIGVEHVALGSDFDGTTIPAALRDASGLPRILSALSDAGFDEDELAAIAWRNWRRVFSEWWSG